MSEQGGYTLRPCILSRKLRPTGLNVLYFPFPESTLVLELAFDIIDQLTIGSGVGLNEVVEGPCFLARGQH